MAAGKWEDRPHSQKGEGVTARRKWSVSGLLEWGGEGRIWVLCGADQVTHILHKLPKLIKIKKHTAGLYPLTENQVQWKIIKILKRYISKLGSEPLKPSGDPTETQGNVYNTLVTP